MINKLTPRTLGLYLARNALFDMLLLLGGLLAIVYLFDTVELLRRASKYDDVPLGLVLQMGLFKLPEVGQIVLPFAVLFGAIYTFWKLNRRYELVVVRAAGLSIWQFLGPVVAVALLIGLFQVGVINPFGALLLSRFEDLESVHLERRQTLVVMSEQGLWLRQDHEDGKAVLHAARIEMPDWQLKDVMVLFFDRSGRFIRRIDSHVAMLEPGKWSFEDADVNQLGRLSEQADFLTMATDLTIRDIEESFATPNTIPLWQLPGFVRTLQSAGFDATSVRIHFQNILAQPLLLMAMIFLAASVSLQPPRSGGTLFLIAGGLLIGFLLFFASSFLQALGASHQIPVLLSVWSVPVIGLLCGVAIMMTLEDG